MPLASIHSLWCDRRNCLAKELVRIRSTMLCDLSTKVGNTPRRVLCERLDRLLAEHSMLEERFLDFTFENHGAILLREAFPDIEGNRHRLGRLVNFLRDRSELAGESVPDWECPGDDLRNEVLGLLLDGHRQYR